MQRWLLVKSLHANWVLQSFAYDNVNQRIYFAQSETGSTNGDLWITRTDLAGNETGSMALHGFGHGVQIAVEPYAGQVYLWTEWMVNTSSGYGTKVGRFAFVNGGVLEKTSSAIQDRTPSIGETMTNPQPAIDPYTSRLLIRYRDANSPRIVAFTLADARAGNLSRANRLAERALPDVSPFQGFTAYGEFAYLIWGAPNETTYITTIDLNQTGTSEVVQFATGAGQSLPSREPQGMAIWLSSGGPRLAFGFESNTSGSRQASVFYKDQLVSRPAGS